MSFAITQTERMALNIVPFTFEGKKMKNVRRQLLSTITSAMLGRSHLYDIGFGLIGRIENADKNLIIVFKGIRSYGNPLFHTSIDDL